jgi:mannose-6-phosphate isomerase-like protein (cupin superfamily)
MSAPTRCDGTMRQARVISEHDVEGRRFGGDTVEEKRTLDAGVLEQRVLRFSPGLSLERGEDERDELLYVASGSGTLVLDGAPHPLEPELGVYMRAGERYRVENPGPDQLLVVSVASPPDPVESGEERGNRRVTVRFTDQPELRADAKRTFRYLVNQDAGCAAVTQFLGVVEPCRAPDHSHSYDEVGYIVEGHGIAHVGGEQIPLGPGSCFHLPPEEVHCIENSGPGVMRILGVFHPSGDPASRSYDDATAGATS